MDGELERSRKPAWSGNAAQRAEIRAKVWGLRVEGYTHREVGDALGISDKFSWTLEQEELSVRYDSEREAMRVQMEERLGRVRRKVVVIFTETADWNAFKGYQWTEERLAKLMSLDAPVVTKAEVTTRDSVDVELEAVVRQMRESDADAG
jgi:hypothetical protein